MAIDETVKALFPIGDELTIPIPMFERIKPEEDKWMVGTSDFADQTNKFCIVDREAFDGQFYWLGMLEDGSFVMIYHSNTNTFISNDQYRIRWDNFSQKDLG